jgi:hypothetical protein
MEVLHPQEALRSRKAELPVQEGDSPAHVDDAPDAELAVGEEEEQPVRAGPDSCVDGPSVPARQCVNNAGLDVRVGQLRELTRHTHRWAHNQQADEDVASIMHLLPESHDRIKGLYKR